jgi:hypothetical protein
MVARREKFKSGQAAQLDSGASLGTADRALFLSKRRTRRRARSEAEALPDEPAAAPAVSPSRLGKRRLLEAAQRAQLERPTLLSRVDKALMSQARPNKRVQFQALHQAHLEAPSRSGWAERMLVRHAWLARRHRYRSAQMAQLDVPSVLPEADRVLLVGTERAPVPQAGLDKRQRLQALQQAQLEAPAVLGKAERVLLGQARLYHRQRFRASQMAQLDTRSVLGESDRMLLIGARGGGWRRRLRSLVQGVAASLDYVQARLKTRRAARQREQAAAAEGLAAAAEPAEKPAPAITGPTWREQTVAQETPGAPPAARAPTEAALLLARAAGRQDLAGQLPVVTAALTELGAPRDEFGLVLRVGSLAPRKQARTSEFTVTGLGLTELSRGLSRWLREADKTDVPLQVIDDGSGKIKVLIS